VPPGFGRPLPCAFWPAARACGRKRHPATALEAPEGLRSKLANWSELSVDERRTVLTALHRRMAEAGREGKLQVRSERRFGYRVQRPDGTVVRIERRQAVVQFRDAEGQSFGVGFEQRSAHPEQQPTAL
jgi:hypothetical protein